MLKKILLSLMVIAFGNFLPLFSQENKLYKWEGDWQWIDANKYHYNFSCNERYYYILGNNEFPDIRSNIIQVYLDIRGVRQQFITLNHKYWWDREYFFIGHGDWGSNEFSKAYTVGEATRLIIEDAIREYIKENISKLKKNDQGKSTAGNASLHKSDSAPVKYPTKQDDAKRALEEARFYYNEGRYIRAGFSVDASLSLYETAEAHELKLLIKKKIAEQREKNKQKQTVK